VQSPRSGWPLRGCWGEAHCPSLPAALCSLVLHRITHSPLITGCFYNIGCEEECVLLCYVFLGLQSEFFINTTKAGPGTLSVTIEGPSKVKMDCQETPEGYKVMYTPMAPGNYLIGVKYGGPNHIVGSPFKAKVTGKNLTSIYCVPEVVCVIQQICPSETGWQSGLDAQKHET